MQVTLAAPWDFPAVAGMLAPVIAKAGATEAEVADKLNRYHAQLWRAVEGETVAALVTQMTTDDVLECWLAGGRDARRWAGPACDAICAWGWKNGAAKCRVWGRKGWIRLLEGWEFVGMEDGLAILERGRG
jgi:hypothetical protein